MEKDRSPLDAIVNSSQTLLNSLSSVDRLVEDLPEQSIADIHSQIRRRAMASIDLPQGVGADARIQLYPTKDGMRCTGSLYPGVGGGSPLEMNKIREELASWRIVYGVRYDSLEDAVSRCNAEGLQVNDVMVAEGRRPIPSIPEHILLEKRLREPQTEVDLDALRVEHKQRSPFVFVRAGEPIAKRIAEKEGAKGRDIYGNELAAPTASVPILAAGVNVVEQKGTLFASISGRFRLDGRTFSVNPVLEVANDVDYSTGHIDFDGDVLVVGDVQEGFNVKATGTLFCGKTVSAGEIECGKDTIVGRGIIGRQDGSVKAGGEIRCKYIEHCYVEAGGRIRASVGIMNSSINTRATVETGPRGIIVGGAVHAQDGVIAGQIGTEMGPATEIYCGVDYSVLNRIEWIRDRTVELVDKLAEVKRSEQLHGDSTGALTRLGRQLREAIRKMNHASATLVSHLDKNEEARVVVRQVVYPNTYIEICHASYVVTQIMRQVSFRLDREKGRIVTEPIRSHPLRAQPRLRSVQSRT